MMFPQQKARFLFPFALNPPRMNIVLPVRLRGVGLVKRV